VPPYRITPPRKEILRNEIERLLNENVIEECESPWAAPVVMVPKKDGSIRLCVDFRRLNAVTVADSYPLPRLDDLIHSTTQTKFMTTIDRRAGYHQINVKSAHRDKTAFVTPFGTFRYNFTNPGSSSSGITKKSDRLLNNNKRSLISHKSIKCLGNWNFDVFRYKNSLTFICHQHQDLTIAKFEIKQ
jgi:hypothetical protein